VGEGAAAGCLDTRHRMWVRDTNFGGVAPGRVHGLWRRRVSNPCLEIPRTVSERSRGMQFGGRFTLFSRTFDAVVAWGLIFILQAGAQQRLIGKVARTLNRQGHFLFTSPKQVCTWMDSMTDLPSISLGHEVYEQELGAHGLVLVGNDEDEGENYYYFATKS